MGSHQEGTDGTPDLGDQVVPRVLTSADERVTLEGRRGHEAEDLIYEILHLSDELIHLLVREEW